jgi:AcrR family transcriptional regulator
VTTDRRPQPPPATGSDPDPDPGSGGGPAPDPERAAPAIGSEPDPGSGAGPDGGRDGSAGSDPSRAPGTVAWWQHRYARGARRRPRSDGLTIERIRAAGLAIVDREGLDAMTMRRLAEDLGTGPASLYRHVANRDELLVEIMDHVLGEIRSPPRCETWREGVEWLARELRRVLSEHPALTQLLPGQRLLGPNAMRGRELALRHLLDHGFGEEDASQTYAIVVGWVLGHTLLSMGTRRPPTDVLAATVFRAVRSDEYPTVHELGPVGVASREDAVFDLGLTTLFDGIEARRANPPAAGPARRPASA